MEKSLKDYYKDFALAAVFGLALGGAAALGSTVGNTDERLTEQYPSLSTEDAAKLRYERTMTAFNVVTAAGFGLAFGAARWERKKKEEPVKPGPQ